MDVPNEYLVDEFQVYHDLRKIKVNKSSGPDVITNKMLKVFAYELAPVVMDICNTSVKQGVFPSILKRSIVVPIPKISLPQTVEEDLRPISLTSQVSQVMEGFNQKKSVLSNKVYT